MSKNKLLQFKLSGVIGYGFLIEHAGIDQYSVAWPNREADRFSVAEAERRGLEISEVVLEATLEEAFDEKDERIKFLEGELAKFSSPQTSTTGGDSLSEDSVIEAFLVKHGLEVTNKFVMESLRESGVVIQSPQVTVVKERLKVAKST
jgi:hypothetical protein